MSGAKASGRVPAWSAAAAVLHAAFALATSSAAFFHLNVGTSQRTFGGSVNARAIFDDVNIYFRYASEVMLGEVPYRDFVIEYPLGALPWFLLPRLAADEFETYKLAFGAQMLLVNAATVWLVARRVATRDGPGVVPGRLAWYSACVLTFTCLTVARFDLAPALFAVAGVIAWSTGRNALGGTMIGLGTLVKIFPAAIGGPMLVIELRRRRPRATIAAALTVVAGSAVWFGLGGRRVAESLGYHVERGLEIGSVYAGVVMLAGKLTGVGYRADYVHAAEEVTGPGSTTLAAIALPIQVACLLLVLWRSRRATAEELPRFAASAVLAFVVAGKVLSPQYMIWLLPMIAIVEGDVGRRARGWFLACCVASMAVYPWSYMGLVLSSLPAIIILNVRNALLVALLVVLLSNPVASPPVRRPRNPVPSPLEGEERPPSADRRSDISYSETSPSPPTPLPQGERGVHHRARASSPVGSN